MQKNILFLCVIFFLAGCTQSKQLAHMDELLTLKGMSENRDEQAKYVDQQNKNFDQLLAVVRANRIKEFPNKNTILKEFGGPVIVSSVMENDQPAEQWLYRYATKYFDTEKVYLYFDAKGNLTRCDDIVPAENVARREPTLAPPQEPSHEQNKN